MAATDAPARTKTSYVILREVATAGEVTGYEPVTSGVQGNSSDHALRTWAETATAGTQAGTYVAIPTRSFRPTKVAFQQQTIVKVG